MQVNRVQSIPNLSFRGVFLITDKRIDGTKPTYDYETNKFIDNAVEKYTQGQGYSIPCGTAKYFFVPERADMDLIHQFSRARKIGFEYYGKAGDYYFNRVMPGGKKGPGVVKDSVMQELQGWPTSKWEKFEADYYY
jgi:hypothetical protein